MNNHSEKYIELAKKLIEFKTVTGNLEENNRCLEYVADYLDSVENVEIIDNDGVKSLIATHQKTKTPSVYLHGHVDVVPVNNDSQFQPKIENGRLYGRGSMDMKGGTSVLIEIFKNNPDKNIGMMLTTDEEKGGFKGAHYLADNGYVPDFLISGEPTWLRVGAQAKGVLQIEVVTKGVQGHSAYPWKGDNALHKQALALAKLSEKYGSRVRIDDIWETSLSCNMIEGGIGSNVMPGESKMMMDIRYIPGDDPDSIIDDIKNTIPDSEISIHEKEPAAYTAEDNTYIQKLVKHVVASEPFIMKHGASDVRHFTPKGAGGCVFGPSGEGMHGDEEYVDLDSLESMYETVNAFIEEI